MTKQQSKPLVKGVVYKDTHKNGLRYQGESSGGKEYKRVSIKGGK